MKPASDGESEADDLELIIHTAAIRVEYYRSFEYCLKWERHMYPRRSSRQQKAKKSPQEISSPDEEVIQRRLKSKRQRTGLRKAEGDNNLVRSDEWKEKDIIDIIDSTHNAQCVAPKNGGKFVEVADKGVDESDEDCCSVTSSVASGPSVLYRREANTPRSSQALCSSCWKLYQRAKKMKAPIKNKLFDNDPKSLTCDQWVLIKDWRPRRLPRVRGKPLTQIQLLVKRPKGKKSRKQTEQEGELSSCSRPHTFLQRNLRRCVTVPVKKETRKTKRKRRKNGSQGSRAAKQRRLHSSNLHQRISNVRTDGDTPQPAGSCSSSPAFDGCIDQEMDSSDDADLTFEVIPSTITLETTEPRGVSAKQKQPKKTGGFRDLLAQLRSNSSMIVRETC